MEMIVCPQCRKYMIGRNSYFDSFFCNKCGYFGDGGNLKLTISSKCDIPFEREVNECLWNYTMIHRTKLDMHENILGLNGNDFENDTFMVRSYSWREDDEDEVNQYHFWHKPSGFKLQWYKYPLRSPYANMEITHEQFLYILRDCTNSIHPNFTYQIDEWWNPDIKKEEDDL